MADYDEDEDFFEEDEPAEKVFAAFNRGEKGITAPRIAFYIASPSLNTGSVVPVSCGSQAGWFVTGARPSLNTNQPPLVRTG
jgi:hypothetical protein